MGFQKSISQRLIAFCVAGIAFLFLLYGIWQVQQVRSSTVERVHGDIESIVKLKATEVTDFFYAKGQIIHSVFANPQASLSSPLVDYRYSLLKP